ncbi:50S ribosomal protein L11 methyltransferase [Helcococcus kunzii]|uniref:Ribosomal protein L11 methyltransferase n=1 Tax=Helcococcus kunzii ATCC 51366 TaxID=883114 RepID=H3NPI4_9FIRM|nr:50S ribosomal protein L11 methyltransferase [Helcococcus kunzii]EHR33212.1 ribosomal protein L11 methyltransferase [Helcococcus kunzii ATCC 51366]MCT1795867.1 50S ribosomal protein L11 methyltransferase [Helcococcus kunzii]MCT1988581.1 50S ribosomal protein L11 methyltransferase [Helcococcus kunzii]QZO75815.1 50S ribosomal protein L11 methyltransferase [Helcococcus kunzii]
MENFLLLTFKLERKYKDLIQYNIYDYENIGFEVDDPIEKRQILSNMPEWEISEIKIVDENIISYGVYFEDSESGQIELDRLVSFLNERIPNFKFEKLLIDNSNWEEEWKKSYKGFEIGNKIYVKPSWEEANVDDKIIIEIDPKMAFGTGTHETTSLCMEYVENQDFSDKKVLDIGCGSGILSILAKKLNAKKVDACDIDEIAVSSAKENAKINDVSINVFESNLFSNVKDKYDIIFANILAEIIVEMLNDVKSYLNEEGIIVLSGIIKEREELVVSKLKEIDFEIIDTKYKNEWVLISARRRNA